MPYKTRSVISGAIAFYGLIALFLAAGMSKVYGYWDFPPIPPADEYGNILINRLSEKNGQKSVTFSHWIHRQKYTCRVCHFELEFNMKANTTDITESASRLGKFCGTSGCHDGTASFGHDKTHCEKCHNGNIGYGKEKFQRLSGLPKTKFGNGIDWVKALKKKMITPVNHLTIPPPEDITYETTMLLEAEWEKIPPAIFPHRVHTQWLDCNNCHPDIFNIKKKTTKHFSMSLNLKGEFCGVCHLSVAFPMNDCKRCHLDINKE